MITQLNLTVLDSKLEQIKLVIYIDKLEIIESVNRSKFTYVFNENSRIVSNIDAKIDLEQFATIIKQFSVK